MGITQKGGKTDTVEREGATAEATALRARGGETQHTCRRFGLGQSLGSPSPAAGGKAEGQSTDVGGRWVWCGSLGKVSFDYFHFLSKMESKVISQE